MAKNFVGYRLLINVIDEYSMRSIAHRLSNDYPSISHWLNIYIISSNFFS